MAGPMGFNSYTGNSGWGSAITGGLTAAGTALAGPVGGAIGSIGGSLASGLIGGSSPQKDAFRQGKTGRRASAINDMKQYYKMMLDYSPSNMNAQYYGPNRNINYMNTTGRYLNPQMEKGRQTRHARTAGLEGALNAYMSAPQKSIGQIAGENRNFAQGGQAPQPIYKPDIGQAYNEAKNKELLNQQKQTPQDVMGKIQLASSALEQLANLYYGQKGIGHSDYSDNRSPSGYETPASKVNRAIESLKKGDIGGFFETFSSPYTADDKKDQVG